jgi:hypothetical protein
VLKVFRSSDLEIAQGATSPALRALVADLDENRHARIKGLTIADIYPGDGSGDDAVPAAIPAKGVGSDAPPKEIKRQSGGGDG